MSHIFPALCLVDGPPEGKNSIYEFLLNLRDESAVSIDLRHVGGLEDKPLVSLHDGCTPSAHAKGSQ